MIVIKLK